MVLCSEFQDSYGYVVRPCLKKKRRRKRRRRRRSTRRRRRSQWGAGPDPAAGIPAQRVL